MSDIINGLIERRSVRKYMDKPVPKDVLELIVKAGSYAPSSMNTQPWHFTVIQNAEVIGRITETLKSASKHESVPSFLAPMVDTPKYTVNYGAPVFILISGDTSRSLSVNDCTLAANNMMLASYALGLGSCWINQPSVVTNVPEFRALLTELGVPRAYDIYACLCLGYPAESHPRPAERKADIANYID